MKSLTKFYGINIACIIFLSIIMALWITPIVLLRTISQTTFNVTTYDGIAPRNYSKYISTLYEYQLCPEKLFVYNNCSTFINYFQFQTVDAWGNNLSGQCNSTDSWYGNRTFSPIEKDYIRKLTWLACSDNSTININYIHSITYWTYLDYTLEDKEKSNLYYTLWWIFFAIFCATLITWFCLCFSKRFQQLGIEDELVQ